MFLVLDTWATRPIHPDTKQNAKVSNSNQTIQAATLDNGIRELFAGGQFRSLACLCRNRALIKRGFWLSWFLLPTWEHSVKGASYVNPAILQDLNCPSGNDFAS